MYCIFHLILTFHNSIELVAIMYSSDSDEDDKIDNLWGFNPNDEKEDVTEELTKEEQRALKKTIKLMETM